MHLMHNSSNNRSTITGFTLLSVSHFNVNVILKRLFHNVNSALGNKIERVNNALAMMISIGFSLINKVYFEAARPIEEKSTITNTKNCGSNKS